MDRTDVHTSVAQLRHADWMRLADTEYARLHDLLDTLDEEDWAAPTDCDGWSVRDIVAHLAGAAASTASIRELARQKRLGTRATPDATVIDAMNAIQVAERTHRSPSALRDELRQQAVRGLRTRRRLPAPVRALRLPFGPPLGTRSIAYLMDRIYTRDAWMHRIDICRATNREMTVSADHDGRLVADVVSEWADTHDEPFELSLAGPAGGRWSSGDGGERISLDAIEFCRVVAGRAPANGLAATPVPF